MEAGRIGGYSGLAFVAGVALQNGILLAGNPLPDATMEMVAEFYRGNRGAIAIAVGLVAINIALLLTFACHASAVLERGGARVAGQVGQSAAVLLAGAFLVTTLLQAVLTARIDDLVGQQQLALLWDLHTAAFVMSATSLAAVLGAFSLGALATGALVPRWTAATGLAGAASLLAAGAMVVPTLDGSPAFFLQFVGFTTWLIFLVVASLRLLRSA